MRTLLKSYFLALLLFLGLLLLVLICSHWLWMVLRVLETVEAHCGYHFPWSLSNFIPLYGGADFPDYHHRVLYTKSGNYSSTFMYMDRYIIHNSSEQLLITRLFGTDKGYRKLKSLKGEGM